MAKIIGKSGALKDLLKKIGDPEINSLDCVFDVINNIEDKKKEVRKHHEIEIDGDISSLRRDIIKLENNLKKESERAREELNNKKEDLKSDIKEIESTIGERFLLIRIYLKIKKNFLSSKLSNIINNYESLVEKRVEETKKKLIKKREKLDYLNNHISEAIEKRAAKDLNRLDNIYKKTKSNKNLLYGAIGEVKVIKILKELSDDYFVVNDFKKRFGRAIHKKDTDDWIKSVQIDHVVVGPTGLFLIETKNWSKESMESLDLYSPVQQIKRANHALFIHINNRIKGGFLSEFNKNWGNKKVSFKNLIAVKRKSKETDFQYVKVLQWDKLINYITYGKEKFSQEEIKALVKFLKK